MKQPPAHSSTALSKSKRIDVKQPDNQQNTHISPAHSSLAHSKSKEIVVNQPEDTAVKIFVI